MLHGVPGRGRRVAAALAVARRPVPRRRRSRRRGSGTRCRWRAGRTPSRPRPGSRRASRPGAFSTRRRDGVTGCGARPPAAAPGEAAGEPGGAAAVPLPLAPDTWRGLLRRDGLPDDQLAVAIVADRRVGPPLPRPGGARRAHARRPGRRSRRRAAALYDRHADVLAAFGARFRVRDGRGGGAGRRGGGAGVGQAGGPEPPGRRWRSCWPCSRRTGDAGPCSTTRWPASTRRASASRSGCTGRRARRAWAPCSRWRRSSTARTPGGAPREALSRGPRRTPRDCSGRCAFGSDGSLAPPAARVFWEAVFDEGKATPGAEWAARVPRVACPGRGRLAGGADRGGRRRRRAGCASSS